MENSSNIKSGRLETDFNLYKQRQLDAYLKRDMDKFKQRFDTLQDLLNRPANNENYEKAFLIFCDIIDAVPLLYNELSGSDIFRAQTNKPNELFSTQSRISYNRTNVKSITPGKFNVWYDPMFYGCLPYRSSTDNEYLPPYLTAAYETCKDLKNRTIGLQDFTIGQWRILSPFYVINLCFDDLHLLHNYELKKANDAFTNNLLANLDSKAGDYVIEIFKYYSNLCRTGRNENAYYLLTAFFNAIRQYYSIEQYDVNGLISCSAATDGTGLNIVMTPEAVDKYLYLNSAFMFRFFLVMPKAELYAAYPCSEIIYNHQKKSDFSFTFNQYIKPAERFLKNST